MQARRRRREASRPAAPMQRMCCLGAVIVGISVAPLLLLRAGFLGAHPGGAGVPSAPFSEEPPPRRPATQVAVAHPKLKPVGGDDLFADRKSASAVNSTRSRAHSHAGAHVVVHTVYGNITMKMREDAAPKHVEYMRALIQRRAYDGCCWYRAERNFVLQGGLRTAAGKVFSSGLPSPPLEYGLPNKRGFVNMARWEDPNSAGGDFCILLKDSPHLDRTGVKGYAAGFTVWAEVVSGMEVADGISARATKSVGGLNMLLDPVTFLSVSLV